VGGEGKNLSPPPLFTLQTFLITPLTPLAKRGTKKQFLLLKRGGQEELNKCT